MESHRMRRRSAEADGAPEDDICPPPEEEDPCIRHSIPHQEALYDFTEKFSESYLQLVHEEMDRVYGQLLADLKAQRAELEGTVEDEEVSRASAKEVLGKEGDKIQRGGNGSEEVSVVTEAVQPSSPAPREENVAEPQADGEGGMLEASLAARSLAHVNGPLFEVLARRALEPYLFPTPPFHPPTSQHENPPSSDSSIPAASTHSLHTSERSFLQHNLDAMKREVIDDLLFLSQVRQIEGLTLSLKQSIAIDERRQYLQALLEHLVALMDHVDLILCVYLLASYDLFRLIGKGTSRCILFTSTPLYYR